MISTPTKSSANPRFRRRGEAPPSKNAQFELTLNDGFVLEAGLLTVVTGQVSE